MGEKLRDNWAIVLFNAAIAIIGTLIIVYFSTKNINAQSLDKKLNEKADKTELIRIEKQQSEFVRKDQFEEFKTGLNTILDYIKETKKGD